mmetsp:Transcript_5346/g.17693  ORF Transcript_5346/g.17693 Transcript_5346/m.17693 type:complete len:237 (-) Transcript_5346:47-757(-)
MRSPQVRVRAKGGVGAHVPEQGAAPPHVHFCHRVDWRHLRHADDAGLAARRRGRGDLGGDDALRRGWVRRVDGADRRRDAPHRGGDPDDRRARVGWPRGRVRRRVRCEAGLGPQLLQRRRLPQGDWRLGARDAAKPGRRPPRRHAADRKERDAVRRRAAGGCRHGAIGAGKVQGRLGGPIRHGLQPSDEFHRGDGEGVPRHNDRLSRVAQVRRRRRCDFNSVRGVLEGGRTDFART